MRKTSCKLKTFRVTNMELALHQGGMLINLRIMFLYVTLIRLNE